MGGLHRHDALPVADRPQIEIRPQPQLFSCSSILSGGVSASWEELYRLLGSKATVPSLGGLAIDNETNDYWMRYENSSLYLMTPNSAS